MNNTESLCCAHILMAGVIRPLEDWGRVHWIHCLREREQDRAFADNASIGPYEYPGADHITSCAAVCSELQKVI